MGDDREPVFVTGMGVVSGAGWGVPAFEDCLSRRHAIRRLDLFDPTDYRTRIAGQVPDSGGTDPTTSRADRFAVAAAEEALQQAKLAPPELAAAGVFFGSSTGGLFESEELFRALYEGRRFPRIRRIASQQTNGPGDAVARRIGVHGPVESHASACTATNMALRAALSALRNGEVDLVLAGGADALCRITYAGFNSLRAVAKEPSRPFRASRSGLSLGEGAGVLVLESAARVRARGAEPLAELAGAGATCDAFHMSAPEQSGDGPAAAMQAAIEDAGLTPEDIDFVNAHGTGTEQNDAVEARALELVFGGRLGQIPLTSTKGVVGHLLGASGAVEAIATVLGLRAGVVHPTPGREPVDPALPVDLVTGAPRALSRAAAALSTSLAFGGSNCAVVFRAVR